ncbi:uncharacterized protein LOC123293762 [Chrysoperla carnea]|uniref:uncharacterized protein LOC123293762 n=1 Tax=Chrysoperla carnea TaxID=189513 RepID=UPI001D07E973|nr:uncharacterized protein LOC123293762 [Chrysoperla carnea]
MENLEDNSDEGLRETNKQIFEIKKKIQLSEGQRKALFESCDAERKANADKILRLKREIAELISKLKQARGTVDLKELPQKLSGSLPPIVADKPYDHAQEIVDLKVIDLRKKYDLIKYKSKQKERQMKQLAKVYQELQQKHTQIKNSAPEDNPLIKKKIDLENEIHRINLQASEAIHIKRKYRSIKDNLISDSVRFENALKKLETAIKVQEKEIKRLQKISNDATKMRDEIFNILENEQKAALDASKDRDEQLNESRRKVEVRRMELHRLERQIIMDAMKSGPTVRQSSEPNSDESEPEEDTLEKDNVTMEEAFTTLKEATGAMSIPEVFERFQAQRKTFMRLKQLRSTTEDKKELVEKQKQKMICELEMYKISSDKDQDEIIAQIAKYEDEIEAEREHEQGVEELLNKHQDAFAIIAEVLHNLCVSLRCTLMPQFGEYDENVDETPEMKEIENEPPGQPEYIQELIKMILERLHIMLYVHTTDIIDHDSAVDDLEQPPKLAYEAVNFEEPSTSRTDEEVAVYPPSYTTLTARSPASQMTTHGPVAQPLTGSEDEDDVPSRGYLKRQAQLIVDAKSRRKTFR